MCGTGLLSRIRRRTPLLDKGDEGQWRDSEELGPQQAGPPAGAGQCAGAVPDLLASLAMTGATTIVAAMATSSWQLARTRTAALFTRRAPPTGERDAARPERCPCGRGQRGRRGGAVGPGRTVAMCGKASRRGAATYQDGTTAGRQWWMTWPIAWEDPCGSPGERTWSPCRDTRSGFRVRLDGPLMGPEDPHIGSRGGRGDMRARIGCSTCRAEAGNNSNGVILVHRVD
jgi:hypothetical protein